MNISTEQKSLLCISWFVRDTLFEIIWSNLNWFEAIWTNIIWLEPNNQPDSFWSNLNQFSEKFAIIVLKKHRKFCRRGFTHLDATPIVQIHMRRPVDLSTYYLFSKYLRVTKWTKAIKKSDFSKSQVFCHIYLSITQIVFLFLDSEQFMYTTCGLVDARITQWTLSVLSNPQKYQWDSMGLHKFFHHSARLLFFK